MPRIKRWFPVSHDINHDPEVWELTDTFGDWLLLAWLDILSVTDRAEGEYMGNPSAIAHTLAKLSLGLNRDKDVVRRRFKGTNAAYRAELALYWMTLKRWIHPIIITDDGKIVLEWWPNHARMVTEWSPNRWQIVGEWWPNGTKIIGFKTRNHWKYHKTQEHKLVPPILPILPILPISPNHSLKKENAEEPAKPEPPADFKKSRELDQEIKAVADRIYQSDPQKFARLIVWIKQAQQQKFETAVIVAALERFEPYAAQVRDWYPYLDKLIYKAKADINRDRSLAEHEQHKEDLRKGVTLFSVKGLVKDA